MIVGVTALVIAPLTAVAGHSFNDVPGSHTFHADITWLADAGVTRGCNPPANTEFCPDDNVTRGQMGAFIRRFAQYIDAEDGTPALADNAEMVDGLDASQLVPGGVVPTGTTIRGTFWMGGTASGSFGLATSEISFGYDLGAAPTPHFIQFGDTPPAECPGSSESPEAVLGHLCIYERGVLSASSRNVNGPTGDGSVHPFGARLVVRSSAGGDFWSLGTWAVTAGSASSGSSSVVGDGKNADVDK